jgi:hypothetical protein
MGCDTDWRAITPGAIFFDRRGFATVDRALGIDRSAQSIDDAPDEGFAHRDFEDPTGTLDDVAFGDMFVLAQHHGADGIALQVQGHTHGVAGKFQHFTLHDVGQTVHADNAVGDGNHRPLGTELGARFQVLDFALDQLADFRRIQLHRNSKILESSF